MLTTNIKTIDDFEKVFGGNLTENKINEIFEKYSNFIIQDEDKLVYTIKPLNSQDSEVYLSRTHDDIFIDMDEKPKWFLYAMDSYQACVKKKEEMFDEIQMPLSDGTNPLRNIDTIRHGFISRDDDLVAFLNGINIFYSKESLESILFMHNRLIKFINDGGYSFSSNYIFYIKNINILLERFIAYNKSEVLLKLYSFYITREFDDSMTEEQKYRDFKVYMQNMSAFDFNEVNTNKLRFLK